MHILVFGDSITQGYDDYEKGGWVNRLFNDISAREDKNKKDYISVFNLGIDGNTSVDVLQRAEFEIEQRKSSDKIVIIYDFGGNDAAVREGCGTNAVDFETFKTNYKSLLKIGKKYGEVICLGLHESEEVLTTENYNAYDGVIKELANEYDSTYVSMQCILSQDFDQLTYDGDHPSPAGHELIYKRVKEALEKENIL